VSGGQKVIRSRTLTADSAAWTIPVDLFDEKNPSKLTAIFSGPNHSSAAVALNDGTHWVLHPVWARANEGEWLGQGRQGLLNQVRYAADGSVLADYPTNKSFTAPALPSGGIPWMVPKSDFFDAETLNPEWSFLGYTATDTHSLTERKGWLRLRPRSTTRLNTVIKTDAEHAYTLITRIDFKPKGPNDEAGLRIMNGDELLFVKLCLTKDSRAKNIIRFSYENTIYSVENLLGAAVWLKLQRNDHAMTAYYSVDGLKWSSIGKSINVANLDKYSVDYNGWCGNRQGLYVQGSSSADFDLYIYRDAYSAIQANCPANWFGTAQGRTSTGEKVLENIHPNDWAMYAGVEFRSENEKKSCNRAQIKGIPSTSNAVVEVWADSLDNGTKIATFKVKAAKKLSEKVKTYVVTSQKISGRHDIFLKFKGKDSKELFKLQSLQFNY
jgi:xylan 1,4-beta-xylosidase